MVGAAAGGVDDDPLRGGHHHVGVGHLGHRAEIFLERRGLPHQLAAGLHRVGGELGDIPGVALQGVLFFPDRILVAQRSEGRAQHEEGQQHHAHHGGELAAVHGFHPLATSNL